jgi:hypothetical protein
MIALLATIIPNPATDAYFEVRAAYKAGVVDEATWVSYVRAAVIPNGPQPIWVAPLVVFA